MKKALLFIVLLPLFFGCSKDEVPANQITVVGRWHLAADTLTTYADGKPAAVQINAYTKQGDHDLQFFRNGEFYIYNSVPYTNALNWGLADKLTLNFPAYEQNGVTVPAVTQTATVKLLTTSRMLLFFDKTTVNGETSVQDFVRVN